MATIRVVIQPIPWLRMDKNAYTKGIQAAAAAIKVDFNVTTVTWNNRPSVTVTTESPARVLVWISNPVYYYVNFGTRPHDIRPVRAKALRFPSSFRPKSSMTRLSSGKGMKSSSMVFAKYVRHPGSKARQFDTRIATKWESQFPIIMQRTIRNSMR